MSFLGGIWLNREQALKQAHYPATFYFLTFALTLSSIWNVEAVPIKRGAIHVIEFYQHIIKLQTYQKIFSLYHRAFRVSGLRYKAWLHLWLWYLGQLQSYLEGGSRCRRENGGILGIVPWLFNPPNSSLKGDIPNKYPVYKITVYKVCMGLIIKGTIPRVPPFSLWRWRERCTKRFRSHKPWSRYQMHDHCSCL